MTGNDRKLKAAAALREALLTRATDDLDQQIGEAAIERYEETVTAAETEACDAVMAWWRAQHPDVAEGFLDSLRATAPNLINHITAMSEKHGVELLAEVVQDRRPGAGRAIYERQVRKFLRAARTEREAADKTRGGAAARVVAGLGPAEISRRFGVGATAAYVERVSEAESEAAYTIVLEWQRSGYGREAIREIVAALENDHPEEIANATRASAGSPEEDLVEILRDDTARELYERLVQRLEDGPEDPGT